MSHQLVIEIPDEVFEPLASKAQATGRSIESVAQAYLAASVRDQTASRPLLSLAGSWASGIPDTGSRHDAYLGQAIHDQLHEPDRD